MTSPPTLRPRFRVSSLSRAKSRVRVQESGRRPRRYAGLGRRRGKFLQFAAFWVPIGVDVGGVAEQRFWRDRPRDRPRPLAEP